MAEMNQVTKTPAQALEAEPQKSLFQRYGLLLAFIVEIILTFVFVMTILGVTADNKTSHLGGLVIGLCLTFVHIMGIPLTGTSVNPARSLAPALLLGTDSLAFSQVWVFILAPLVGGALAAIVWNALHSGSATAQD